MCLCLATDKTKKNKNKPCAEQESRSIHGRAVKNKTNKVPIYIPPFWGMTQNHIL